MNPDRVTATSAEMCRPSQTQEVVEQESLLKSTANLSFQYQNMSKVLSYRPDYETESVTAVYTVFIELERKSDNRVVRKCISRF